jgi:lipopolysaccharide exporter
LKNSYWLRSGFYTLSEKATSLLFGFGSAVLLFRNLTKEEFGTWVLFLTIVSILEVGRIGLLQNALIKYLATHEGEDAGEINTASLVLNILMTAGIVVVLLVLAGPLSVLMKAPGLAQLLRIYTITTALLVPFFQFNYIQQANLDFKGIFWSTATRGGILFSFVLFMFVQSEHISLTSLAVCQIASAGVASVIAWHFAKPYSRYARHIDWGWINKLFGFGKYVFGTNLSTQLFRNVDKLLLGSLPAGGTAAVALYDAAMRITNLMDVPTASMASILYPQSAKRMEEGKRAVKDLYEKAVGAILVFMFPCITGVLFFAEWIITIVAGPGYEEAANLLRITVFFGLFVPYAVQFGTVLDSIGKPRVNFYFTLMSLGLTALCNWIFISRYGVFGAATGTLTAYVITFVVMQFYLNKILKINPLNALVYMAGYYRQIGGLALKIVQGKVSLKGLSLVAKD